MSARRQSGLTLIELMFAVAIGCTLLALAAQAFVAHQRRGGRLDATTALMEVGQAQERHYAQHGRYAEDLATLRVTGTERGLYELALESDGSTYIASAHAAGGQAQDEDCAVFLLQSDGRRRALDAMTADNSAACWR